MILMALETCPLDIHNQNMSQQMDPKEDRIKEGGIEAPVANANRVLFRQGMAEVMTAVSGEKLQRRGKRAHKTMGERDQNLA